MNTGLVTSFIIGGLLLLSILAMNINMTRSSASLTMRQITQQNVKTAAEVITYDFDKIGFKQFGKISNPIKFADSTKIVFESDIDTSGTTEQVTWHFDMSTNVNSSSHPDARMLKRTVGGNTIDFSMGVTSFKLIYLNKDLNSTSALDEIRHIKVEMTVSSKESLGKIGGGSAEYIESTWSKTFTPKNIK